MKNLSDKHLLFYMLLLFAPLFLLMYVLNSYNTKLKECVSVCEEVGELPFRYDNGLCYCEKKK